MAHIAHLPKAVVGQLRSSSILSDIAQAVEELICNSLDAGAKKICVCVDLSSFFIKVEDDGSGVTRDDLKLMGERHATSKLHDMVELESGVSTLGFRGEALSSLSDIGIVEIITRTRGSPHTYMKILKGSKKLSIGLYSEHRAPGTTVVLRELFHNLPVRRKVVLSSPKKVLQGVKDRAVRLALIHPDVTFIVFDKERQENLLCTKPCLSSLDTLCNFFGSCIRHELLELCFVKNSLKLNGFVSKESRGCPSKAIQFFYLNGRFVHKTPVHKLINTLFLRSSCCPEPENSQESDFSFIAGKQVYPIFLINLQCPLSNYDITFEATKTSVEFKDWNPILSFITEALGSQWISRTGKCDREGNVPEFKKATPCRRRRSWQHVDPSYYPKCSVDIPNMCNQLDEVYECQGRDGEDNVDQDLKFCTSKGTRTPRKRRSGQEWSFEPCRTRRNLDSEVMCDRTQLHSGRMDQSDCFQGLSKKITAILDDDVLNGIAGPKDEGGIFVQEVPFQDNSLLTSADLAEMSTDIPVVDLDTYTGHDGRKGTPFDARMEPLLSECFTKSESLCLPRCQESTSDTMIDFMPTPPQLQRSFAASNVRVRRCLYKLKMNTNTDDFWCHSDRQIISNFEFQCGDPRSLGLSSRYARNTLSLDSPGQCFLNGCEGEFNKGSPQCDGLLEYKFPVFLQEREESDSLQTDVRKEFSFLGEEVNSLQHHFLMDATADEPRPQTKKLGISSSLSYSKDSHFASKMKNSSKQTKTRTIMDLPTKKHFQRSQSAPPFYRPRLKYGQSKGLSTFECSGRPQNRYDWQAASQRSTEADTKKDIDKERLLGPPSHIEQLDSASGLDIPLKTRGSQEDILPHQDIGFSPPAKDNDADCLQSRWTGTVPDDIAIKDVNALQLYKNWKNPCIRSTEPCVLDLSSGVLGPNSMHLLPETITKEQLQQVQVLQQMDKKFIASVAERVLVVIDQHAADERIRLEQLRKEVLDENQHLSTLLDYPKELSLSVGDQQLLYTYKAQLEQWGWHFKLLAKGNNEKGVQGCPRGNFDVLLTAVPSILGESLNSPNHLSEYLHQLESTDGISVPPPAVQRVLASKACRGAIMFGDRLLRSECQQLVEALKKTALSFQCAHGRPTLVPIVNLEALHLCLNKLQSNTNLGGELGSSTWHGLARHRPTLVRATERLQRAEDM